MAQLKQIQEFLENSRWGEALDRLLQDERRAMMAPFSNEALEKSGETVTLATVMPLILYMRTQIKRTSQRPYMVVANAEKNHQEIKVTDYLMSHSVLPYPYITTEQREYLWENRKDNEQVYLFTHIAEASRCFTCWEAREMVSRAISTEKDVYFVLVRERTCIGMKYDYEKKEFFSVRVKTS